MIMFIVHNITENSIQKMTPVNMSTFIQIAAVIALSMIIGYQIGIMCADSTITTSRKCLDPDKAWHYDAKTNLLIHTQEVCEAGEIKIHQIKWTYKGEQFDDDLVGGIDLHLD